MSQKGFQELAKRPPGSPGSLVSGPLCTPFPLPPWNPVKLDQEEPCQKGNPRNLPPPTQPWPPTPCPEPPKTKAFGTWAGFQGAGWNLG